jgi:hypothetical protein
VERYHALLSVWDSLPPHTWHWKVEPGPPQCPKQTPGTGLGPSGKAPCTTYGVGQLAPTQGTLDRWARRVYWASVRPVAPLFAYILRVTGVEAQVAGPHGALSHSGVVCPHPFGHLHCRSRKCIMWRPRGCQPPSLDLTIYIAGVGSI